MTCTQCGATFYSAAPAGERVTCPQCGGRLEADAGGAKTPGEE